MKRQHFIGKFSYFIHKYLNVTIWFNYYHIFQVRFPDVQYCAHERKTIQIVENLDT